MFGHLKAKVESRLRRRYGGYNIETDNLALVTDSYVRRILYFNRLLDRIADVKGNIVECGVGQGRGLAAWAGLSRLKPLRRVIWGFDSFEGFPKLSEQDESARKFEATLSGYKMYDMPYVYNTLVRYGLSKSEIDSGIVLAKGFIPESLVKYDRQPVALLHLDLDIYEPYKAAMEYFWDLVPSGAVIAFDEYSKPLDSIKWDGAEKAVREFLGSKMLQERLERDELTGNVFIVKP